MMGQSYLIHFRIGTIGLQYIYIFKKKHLDDR